MSRRLIPVQYGSGRYPKGIVPVITETAGHFDKVSISPEGAYSLHTEYSYGPRHMNSPLLEGLNALLTSVTPRGVPRLWSSPQWAIEFSEFIQRLVGTHSPPKVIEVHPPFLSDCSSVTGFIDIYRKFEEQILAVYPQVELLIENRYGSTGGTFLVSTGTQIRALSDALDQFGVRLKIAFDAPQLYSSRGGVEHMDSTAIENIMRRMKPAVHNLRGLHLWGKRKAANGRPIAHQGDLDSYFDNHGKKQSFLEAYAELFSDELPRFFVPEVNSAEPDLHAIVSDLLSVGFTFQPLEETL